MSSRGVPATRAAKWSATGETCFIAGEDLTCQAGLAVQQDLALGALIGVTHAERNGHHYVDGFADTPAAEAEAFLAAHPDLYFRDGVFLAADCFNDPVTFAMSRKLLDSGRLLSREQAGQPGFSIKAFLAR